jgi:hypothetical protein
MSFNSKNYIIIFLLLCTASYSNADSTKVYNPFWVDSILAHQVDSAAMTNLLNKTAITKSQSTISLPQTLRNKSTQLSYFYIIVAFLTFFSILFFFFDDIVNSIKSSLYDTKKYNVLYTAHKFDNIFVNILLFILKGILFSYVVLIFMQYSQKNNAFVNLNFTLLFQILLIVSLFLISKIILEKIIIWVTNQQKIFNFVSIYKLYYDVVFGFVIAFLSIIVIYNNINIINNLYLIGIILYILLLLYKLIQLQQFVKIQYKFYFILYICTLKIMPLILLAKYLWCNYKINIHG